MQHVLVPEVGPMFPKPFPSHHWSSLHAALVRFPQLGLFTHQSCRAGAAGCLFHVFNPPPSHVSSRSNPDNDDLTPGSRWLLFFFLLFLFLLFVVIIWFFSWFFVSFFSCSYLSLFVALFAPYYYFSWSCTPLCQCFLPLINRQCWQLRWMQ